MRHLRHAAIALAMLVAIWGVPKLVSKLVFDWRHRVRWERPSKPLPAFELADLSGRTWTSADLRGRAVLINVWSTWCVPCRAELPQLQRLFDTVKDRADVQVLTMNIDEDPAAVDPFVRRMGLTLPVLSAYTYVTAVTSNYNAVPQTWIIDPRGTWRWRLLGYDSKPDWVTSMLRRMESVRSE